MQDAEYRAEQIAAYGSTEQPAIAARMAPHLRLTQVGVASAAIGVVLAIAAVALFPSFTGDAEGRGWAITALVSAILMLALCVIQLVVWRIAMASWRGVRPEDLRTEARLSWIAHLISYPVALLALFAGMAGSAAAGWTATAAVLLAFSLLTVLAAQALAAVQFLRPSGPPGTLPAHMRRLIARAQPRRPRPEDGP
jgi:MFS family permease